MKTMLANIKPATFLFLRDFQTNTIHGVFKGQTAPAMNIIPAAWKQTAPGQSFPAQVRVARVVDRIKSVQSVC